MRKILPLALLIALFSVFVCDSVLAETPPVIGPSVQTIAPTNMNITSVRGRGRITNTNGVNASNRGVIIYEYTDTDKIIGDAGVTISMKTATSRWPAIALFVLG